MISHIPYKQEAASSRYTLDCGLRLLYRPLQSPVVYVGIAIGVGTRHEKRGEYGLAHFTEHMLFKGTTSRSSTDIINELEEVGGEINAYTSKEETIVYAICPREYAERALRLLADLVQNSIFDAEELRKEQTVVIDEIQSYEDSPSELIWDEFEDIVFKGHPIGHGILGTEKSVANFTQKGELSFYQRHYRPERMAVFIHGDIDMPHLLSVAQDCFPTANSTATAPEFTAYPPAKLQLEPKQIVRRRGTHQRHVLIGATAYDKHDKRCLGLRLLVNILGGPGMSSRLNMSLRERAGLVYNVECNYTAYSDTGLVAIYFGCASRNEQEAIRLAMDELRQMSSIPLSEEELSAAKRQLKGQLTVASDGHENYFLALGKTFLHKDKIDETLSETMDRIDSLVREDLFEIAQEIFAPERMFTLIYK